MSAGVLGRHLVYEFLEVKWFSICYPGTRWDHNFKSEDWCVFFESLILQSSASASRMPWFVTFVDQSSKVDFIKSWGNHQKPSAVPLVLLPSSICGLVQCQTSWFHQLQAIRRISSGHILPLHPHSNPFNPLSTQSTSRKPAYNHSKLRFPPSIPSISCKPFMIF